MIAALERATRSRKIRGPGAAGNVGAIGRIHRDRESVINIVTAKICGVDQRRTARIELGNKPRSHAGDGLSREAGLECRSCSRESWTAGVAGYVGMQAGIDRDA